jgi:hypothetical protein
LCTLFTLTYKALAISLYEHGLYSMESIFSYIYLDNGFSTLEHQRKKPIYWSRWYISYKQQILPHFASTRGNSLKILCTLAHILLHFMSVQYWSNERDYCWPQICAYKCIDICVIYFLRISILNKSQFDFN